MEKSNFLLLLSMNKDSGPAAKAFLMRIKTSIDQNAEPLWIDSKGIGVFITTDLPTWKIWQQAWPDTLTKDQAMDLQNFLVVQVGPGWEASRDGKPAAWLNARYPKR